MTTGARWEHGSDFHWFDWPTANVEAFTHPWGDRATFYGSGRDALRALLEFGAAEHGWRRLLVPSYYCQEVLHSIVGQPLPVFVYEDTPGTAPPAIHAIDHRPDDVVLVVNHFGIREPPVHLPAKMAIIEDHTHDPWSAWAYSSSAMYCFASLRKTLPLPDGAVTWSPTLQLLPTSPPLTEERQLASAQRMAGSLLKRAFLSGHRVDKDTFRALFLSGEGAISSGTPSGMTPWSKAILGAFPVGAWRDARLEGWNELRRLLEASSDVHIIAPEPASTFVPFALAVVCKDGSERERIRKDLIARRVYATILWQLDQPAVQIIPEPSVALSERIIVMHCDGRYTDEDLRLVAAAFEEASYAPS